MHFQVGVTKNSQKDSWWLYGDNHEMVAWAGQTFPSPSNARRAALEFKAGAATATYEIYLDAGNEYRWRARRSSDKVAASGESFASKYNAQRAADNVKDNARYATGP
jgi:uncharacterized protein YegP (UPF0339 family)